VLCKADLEPIVGIVLFMGLMMLFLIALYVGSLLWESYQDVARESCKDLMTRLEGRPEFLEYRRQVIQSGRRFVYADVRVLDRYEESLAEWQRQSDREQQLAADCQRLYDLAGDNAQTPVGQS